MPKFKKKRKVGVIGFEPTTLCSQSRCASQTALHPVFFVLIALSGPIQNPECLCSAFQVAMLTTGPFRCNLCFAPTGKVGRNDETGLNLVSSVIFICFRSNNLASSCFDGKAFYQQRVKSFKFIIVFEVDHNRAFPFGIGSNLDFGSKSQFQVFL